MVLKKEIKMGILIINENYEPFDEKVAKIDAWYDRHSRNWIIQLLNKDGYQVGNAIIVGSRSSKDYEVRSLKDEYGL